jgi:uncharacterized tellurite resistance protein B-like protein
MLPRMKTDADYHPALSLPEPQRCDYLKAIASLVLADGLVDPKEIGSLSALCKSLQLSPESERAVLDSAKQVDRAAVDAWLESTRRDPALRSALMIDAIVMVMVDGKVVSAEAEAIASLSRKVGISIGEAALIGRYVETVVMRGETDPDSSRLSRELAEGLATSGKGTTSPGRISRLFKTIRGQS